MPFYKLDELEKKKSAVNNKVESGAVPGEFMKFGIVTKPEGEGQSFCDVLQSKAKVPDRSKKRKGA